MKNKNPEPLLDNCLDHYYLNETLSIDNPKVRDSWQMDNDEDIKD